MIMTVDQIVFMVVYVVGVLSVPSAVLFAVYKYDMR